jgi:hypothetical protein
MKIGLIGEYPTDIKAVAALLRKEFGSEIAILPLLLDIHGDNLNPEQKNEKGKVKRLLRQEFEWEKPDVVIFIRDLDATPLCEDYTEKIFRKKRYFTEYRSIVGKDKALFLLNVYELEALIFANIEVFNKEYIADLQPVENIYHIKDPKGLLKTAGNKKYNQSDNPALFKLLEIDVLKANAPHLKLLLDKILQK